MTSDQIMQGDVMATVFGFSIEDIKFNKDISENEFGVLKLDTGLLCVYDVGDGWRHEKGDIYIEVYYASGALKETIAVYE